jgi:hypothetical protein
MTGIQYIKRIKNQTRKMKIKTKSNSMHVPHDFQVITYLLNQEGIEMNSTNAMGLTPLDVLLVSSLYSAVDISLVNTIRRAGGVGGIELRDLESNTSNSAVVGTRPPGNQRLSRGNRHMAREKHSDAQTLLIHY